MSSKRYKKLPEKTKELKTETIDTLLPKIKKNCTTKFDESVDIHFQINLKQKKGDINLRTVTNLPSGTGKKIKVAVICEDEKLKEAKDSGSDFFNYNELIYDIIKGKIKSFKGSIGNKKDQKKAIVTLIEGNTIDSSLEIK